jgi:hypothetical protein
MLVNSKNEIIFGFYFWSTDFSPYKITLWTKSIILLLYRLKPVAQCKNTYLSHNIMDKVHHVYYLQAKARSTAIYENKNILLFGNQ